jgi:hypothetical protein
MAISNGFWPLNLSVESLVLHGIVPYQMECLRRTLNGMKALDPKSEGFWCLGSYR